MSKLDEILDTGELETINLETEQKNQIKALFMDFMDDIDPLHTAEWYIKLRQKVEAL